MSSFGLIEALKKLQPSLAVLLLVNQLELPSVIKGIRLAVTDVLAPGADWALVLQRVNAILRPGRPASSGDVTPEELAGVEAILAGAGGDFAEAGSAGDWRAESVRLARQPGTKDQRNAPLLSGEPAAVASAEAPPEAPARGERLAALEAEVRELRNEVRALGERLDKFRAQFE